MDQPNQDVNTANPLEAPQTGRMSRTQRLWAGGAAVLILTLVTAGFMFFRATSPLPAPTIYVTEEPSPTPSSSPTSDPTEQPLVGLQPHSAIPWEEVGPEWALMQFRPEGSDGTTDQWWLMSPERVFYLAHEGEWPGDGELFAWRGDEAWVYVETDPGIEISTGDRVIVNLANGQQDVIATSKYDPGRLQPVANAGWIAEQGCCASFELTFVAIDGATRHLTKGEHPGGWLAHPDGSQYAQLNPDERGSGSPYEIDLVDLDGNARTVATFTAVGSSLSAWLSPTELLLAERVGDPNEFALAMTVLDVSTGALRPWTGTSVELSWPEQIGTTAFLNWSHTREPVRIVTLLDGSPVAHLGMDDVVTALGSKLLVAQRDGEGSQLVLFDEQGERQPVDEMPANAGTFVELWQYPPAFD